MRGAKDREDGHVRWTDRIRHFTWNWFASTMSTGSVAVVLAQTPYRFTGLTTIGKIFFIVDLVMIIAGIVLMATRFVLRPRALAKSLHHPPEALFFGSFWVSIALMLNSVALYGIPSCGPWLIKALEVCFWLYAALILLVSILEYAKLFAAEHLAACDAMPGWIMPMYPCLVIGPLAATLVKSQPREAAVPMLVGGIVFQGLGWTVSLFIYTIYVLRLMSSELPPPPSRPAMFISVGPAGYTSAAFVALGVQAQSVLPRDFMGSSGIPTGEVLRVIGITTGLFFWLLAFWFFATTVMAVVQGFRRMRFTLSWWAFIFPNGGLTLATIQIGIALESDGIKGVAAAMTILLVLAWLVVAGACARALWRREILWPGKDEDKDMDV